MPESPIGSIIAYGGEIDRNWELQNGWLRCDGRLLDGSAADYAALFTAIGFAWGGDRGTNMFNVPDLQGFFLRGVDKTEAAPKRPVDIENIPIREVPSPVDTERDQRFQYRPGGAQGRWVGSVQLHATARPWTSFYTDTAPDHQHGIPFEITAARDVNGQRNTVANPWRWGDKAATESAGSHSHYIHGGDSETRPINAYVHWIIHYR